jgi:hypothetical protein
LNVVCLVMTSLRGRERRLFPGHDRLSGPHVRHARDMEPFGKRSSVVGGRPARLAGRFVKSEMAAFAMAYVRQFLEQGRIEGNECGGYTLIYTKG